MKKTSSIIRMIASILIIVVGIVSLIVGVGSSSYYGYTRSITYGGDAYTGIQNAAADTANNIAKLGGDVSDHLNTIGMFAGIIVILAGVYMLALSLRDLELKKKAKEVPAEAEVAAPIDTPNEPVGSEDYMIEKIEKYKKLLDAGAITEEEYDTKKKQILDV